MIIPADEGTPIHAIDDGRVRIAGPGESFGYKKTTLVQVSYNDCYRIMKDVCIHLALFQGREASIHTSNRKNISRNVHQCRDGKL